MTSYADGTTEGKYEYDILNRNRESIIHAMMLDPLSAAACSPAEIRAMAEELFAAEKKFIPNWCQAKKPRARRATRKASLRINNAA